MSRRLVAQPVNAVNSVLQRGISVFSNWSMLIVRCALFIAAAVWSPAGEALRAWSRHFGTETHLLSSSRNAVFDRRTRRLVETIEQKLALSGRLVILLCARRCYPAQSLVIPS